MTLSVNPADPGRDKCGCASPVGKAGSVKVRELIRVLEDDGWRKVRTTGSHRQFKHFAKPGVVTVAGRLGLAVPFGTMKSILKQAGLKAER